MIIDNTKANDNIRHWLDRLATEIHPWERDHAERVMVYSLATAEKLGWTANNMENLHIASALHDVGKLDLPSGPWANPTMPVHEGASDKIQSHAQAGADILLKNGFSPQIAEIVAKHHERLDGSGYPNRLAENDIPPESRIIGLAEYFDGIAFGPWSKKGADEARNWVISAWPGLWGADVVTAFLAIERQIQPIT